MERMTESSSGMANCRLGWRRALPDLVGVLWVMGAGVALLIPVLLHGTHIGTYDILSQLGLTKQHGITVHNPELGDQIDSLIPWSALAWTQVHHGLLPLWNPYNGFGLPLAFNWQSATFALPTLVGYLVPLQYAYDAGIFVTLFVAGTGAYVLARVLGLRVLACAFAGVAFELSGPLIGWLGFPHAEVMSWAGWLFAAAILVIRPEHRVRDIAIFAVVLAMAVYSGQPEVLATFGLALVLFVGVLMVQRTPLLRGTGPILRPLADLSVASITGLALAAPLALPGLQVISQSTRDASGAGSALHLHDFIYFITQGFDGIPIAGSAVFGQSYFYNETAAYVGIIAVVLAALAVTVRFRRPEVVSFSIVTIVMVAFVFVSPARSILGALPVLGKVEWDRGLMPVALGVAVLSAFGLDALVRSHPEQRVRRWSAVWFAASGLMLVIIFVVGRGALPRTEAGIRASSFVGPAIGIVVGAVIVLMLSIANRRQGPKYSVSRRLGVGSVAGFGLLVFETAFLVSAGTPIQSSSSTFLKSTPAEVSLQKTVGTSTVGFGYGDCGQVGIDPSDNDFYGVHELDAYDPIIPQHYYTSWLTHTGTPTGIPSFNEFCPLIKTSSEARLYGVSFVLEPIGSPGPQGTVFVKNVGDESLYHVPGSGIATLTPLSPSGALPAVEAEGSPVNVTQPDPTTWKMAIMATSPQILRLRLTDLPGWHASIDGHPVPLVRFAGVMLQLKVPPGRHTVELSYWPKTFTVGIVLAVCALIGLLVALVIERSRRPRGRTTMAPGSPPGRTADPALASGSQ
jgi:hypothetical protein